MTPDAIILIAGAATAFYYFLKRDSEYCPTPLKDPLLLFFGSAAAYFLGLQYIEAAPGALLGLKKKRIVTAVLLIAIIHDTLAKPFYYGLLLSLVVIRWECHAAPKYEKLFSAAVLTPLSPISPVLYALSYAISKKFKPMPEAYAAAMIIALTILYRYGYTNLAPITALSLGSMYNVEKKKEQKQYTRHVYV